MFTSEFKGAQSWRTFIGALLGFLAFSPTALGQSAGTPHSHASAYGPVWECDRGYELRADTCDRVAVPEHAYLDDSGEDWQCNRGYRRAGGACRAISVPAHGHLSDFSDLQGWDCDRGYHAVESRCVAIRVPPRGYLIASGDD